MKHRLSHGLKPPLNQVEYYEWTLCDCRGILTEFLQNSFQNSFRNSQRILIKILTRKAGAHGVKIVFIVLRLAARMFIEPYFSEKNGFRARC